MAPERPLYEITPIPSSGLGLIATALIPCGTQILTDAPLFTLPRLPACQTAANTLLTNTLRALPKSHQRLFLSLHNAHPLNHIPPLLGTFKTNTHPLGPSASESGIFPLVSRINHSCAPNACYSWHQATRRERVYATRDIAQGEQITVDYLPADNWRTLRTARQARLLEHFGFNCECETCSGQVEASDTRRAELAQLDEERRKTGSAVATRPGKVLGVCKRLVELLREEGVGEMALYGPLTDAFQVVAAHGDLARAVGLASLAMGVMEVCKGADATGMMEIVPCVKWPERHQAAGVCSKRWRTRKGAAKEVGSEGFEEWLWGRAE